MPTVRDLLTDGAARLHGDAARYEVALLLSNVLRVSGAWLVAHADDAVGGADAAAFESLVARRSTGEPIAYLTCTRGFHALDLRVTPEVLIPRPETEVLVDEALRRIPMEGTCRIADLGTGSGAIALAIASARPRAQIVATDISAAALAVARGNAARLGIRTVAFEQGDWLRALGGATFDVVVSNPPYIAAGDAYLHEGDLRFEPPLALSPGTDGLADIRTLVRRASTHLRDGGWLLLEHGFDQGAAARDLLEAAGWCDVLTVRDLEQRERVSGGRWARPG